MQALVLENYFKRIQVYRFALTMVFYVDLVGGATIGEVVVKETGRRKGLWKSVTLERVLLYGLRLFVWNVENNVGEDVCKRNYDLPWNNRLFVL